MPIHVAPRYMTRYCYLLISQVRRFRLRVGGSNLDAHLIDRSMTVRMLLSFQRPSRPAREGAAFFERRPGAEALGGSTSVAPCVAVGGVPPAAIAVPLVVLGSI